MPVAFALSAPIDLNTQLGATTSDILYTNPSSMYTNIGFQQRVEQFRNTLLTNKNDAKGAFAFTSYNVELNNVTFMLESYLPIQPFFKKYN